MYTSVPRDQSSPIKLHITHGHRQILHHYSRGHMQIPTPLEVERKDIMKTVLRKMAGASQETNCLLYKSTPGMLGVYDILAGNLRIETERPCP